LGDEKHFRKANSATLKAQRPTFPIDFVSLCNINETKKNFIFSRDDMEEQSGILFLQRKIGRKYVSSGFHLRTGRMDFFKNILF